MKTLQDVWPQTPAKYARVVFDRIVSDSRHAGPGALFVALKGSRHDGRQFIAQVIHQGVSAVLSENEHTREENGIPVIGIPDLSARLGEIADCFYGSPGASMQVVAITGTNGKTSIAQLIARAVASMGRKAGVLGTLGNGLIGELSPSTHTTLDPLQLHHWLARFRDSGADVVALEASSHGLEQGRLNGVRIRTAIFTNLTRDHLDYHGTMASYQAAKAKLFQWSGLDTAILNADDPASEAFAVLLTPDVRCWRYSQNPASPAEFAALAVKPSLEGLFVRCRTPFGDCDLNTRLLGRFNISNLLAVLAGLLSVGVGLDDAVAAISRLEPVPGRMQCLGGNGVMVVVDYAHTPDALEKVLTALREHVQGSLWCVFGCGGDRDAGKRPLMGCIAARLADVGVLTSDNPRSEDPETIIGHILTGIQGGANVRVILDRREAIRAAILSAEAGDMVLVAGKGHEDYQEIQGVRHHFDDVEEVRYALRLRADRETNCV